MIVLVAIRNVHLFRSRDISCLHKSVAQNEEDGTRERELGREREREQNESESERESECV